MFKKAAEKVMLAGVGVVMLVATAIFGTDDSDELDDWAHE